MTELQDQPKLKAAQRPRTAARVAAVQALFQIEQNGDRPDSVIEQFLIHRFGTTLSGESYEDGRIPEADVALFTTIINGAVSNRTAIESDIAKTLPSTWPIERLDPVLRALFVAAIAEFRLEDVPAAVLINEYMDVAHGFFFGDEPRLVNGVLDTLFKNPAPVEDHDSTTPPQQQTDLPPEFAFIRRHFVALAGPAALNLQDDAAVFPPPRGREMVMAVDTMVENIHFLPTDPPDTIGRKLLRCNLSDLAAMGSLPQGWLLAFARPPHITDDWVGQFCAGLGEDQARFGLSLMGGDTTSTSGPLVLSLTILGSVLPGQAIRRCGARAGDGLWVSGTIGDGALGLQVLQGHALPDPTGYLAQRYRLPQPRVGLPLYGLASAAMDVSDGLVQDAGHLARDNGLHVRIQADSVPLSAPARKLGDAWLKTCLTGGDDYEILFAVPQEHEAQLLASPGLPTPYGTVPVTRIGQFEAGPVGVSVIDGKGQPMRFKAAGWSHL